MVDVSPIDSVSLSFAMHNLQKSRTGCGKLARQAVTRICATWICMENETSYLRIMGYSESNQFNPGRY